MPEIILFTQPECPPCEFLKLFLQEHNILYNEKNIKFDPKARQELMNTFNSFSTPTLVINNEVFTAVQFNEIKRALGIE